MKVLEKMKRDTILIFEDNAIERGILAELFQSEYKILRLPTARKGL